MHQIEKIVDEETLEIGNLSAWLDEETLASVLPFWLEAWIRIWFNETCEF